ATGAKLSGFIRGELVFDVDLARRHCIARTYGVEFQPQQAVGMLEMAVFHVEGKAAKKTGLSHDYARNSGTQSDHTVAAGIVEIGCDAVGTVVDRRNHAGRN